jgi:general secretion pathway protein M
MTDSLIRLLNASRRSQRLVAICVLLLMGLVAVSLIQTAIQFVWDQQNGILEQRNDLARISALIAKKPNIEASSLAPATQTVFLEGGDSGVLQAKLQDIVASISTTAGTTISSATGIPETMMDGVPFIGLRVDLEGGVKPILDTIVAIETFQPQLLIQRAQMHATNVPPGETVTDVLSLSTQLTIYAAIKPTDDAPPGGSRQ